MKTTNILIAGVGGQGLVLATRIIAGVAYKAGFQVKTSDVIGLSQRGGMVWGSVRFGDVHSPLIPRGQGDFLLALEDLEGLRWVELMKPGAVIITGKEEILPNRVLIEKEEYPKDITGKLTELGFSVQTLDAKAIAREIGNLRLANTVLLGSLSRHLPFAAELWAEVLRESVPSHTIEQNLLAFQKGMSPS
ncbi:MAG: indolepyruvate oxidoreductase subunit beta [Selenomonadales bacterium]|nr:indolepyruvate oxidoreductase subunit beta [Selenomonadales bacterium]